MKAIETRYKGYRFRSRLEARWAVFFDTLGVRYQYEPEGYELDGKTRYLPDFYLQDMRVFVEIKAAEPSHEEKLKAQKLAETTGFPVAILYGQPGIWKGKTGELKELPYRAWVHSGRWENCKILFNGYTWQMIHGYYFCSNEYSRSVGLSAHLLKGNIEHNLGFDVPVFDGTHETAMRLIELDKAYYKTVYGKPHPQWEYGLAFDKQVIAVATDKQGLRLCFTDDMALGYYDFVDGGDCLTEAYNAARSARFEFGESGAA